jgi:hypothetical protein
MLNYFDLLYANEGVKSDREREVDRLKTILKSNLILKFRFAIERKK